MTLNNLIEFLKLQEGFCDDTRLVIHNNDPDDGDSIHYGSYKYAKDSNVFNMYGNRDVVSWRVISNGFHIIIDSKRYCENQKFSFRVENHAYGIGFVAGRVELTFPQAEVVKYATDPKNWKSFEAHIDGGEFHIDLDSAVPVEES